MTISMIAARSENGVIAQDGRLPWHLPDDVAHFRRYCQGKWLLLGRCTWEEMRGWVRPGQTPIVVTRQPSLDIPGGYAVGSVKDGLALAELQDAPECVVVGGGQVFAAALPFANVLILTEVHAIFDGDVFFPSFSPADWQETERHYHPADEIHACAFTIRHLVRRT